MSKKIELVLTILYEADDDIEVGEVRDIVNDALREHDGGLTVESVVIDDWDEL